MSDHKSLFDKLFRLFLSKKTKEKSEQIVIIVSIISFLLHLIIIGLNDLNIIELNDQSKLLTNPIAAIYTPFSFILIYEVYLLVYYLPKSTSLYIRKQYEIITLIIIRRIFKDLANLDLQSDWFQSKDDLQFTYDIIATLVLFTLIFIFHKLNRAATGSEPELNAKTPAITRFIQMKKLLGIILVPVFLFMACFSLGEWIYQHFVSIEEMVDTIFNVNNIFFDQFFTVLILTDVLLLLFSFLHTDRFSIVIRNSGFIISTILIRLSFSATGLLNTALIVAAVIIGVLILTIYHQYERLNSTGSKQKTGDHP